MNSEILNNLQIFTTLLDSANKSTERIIMSIKREDWEAVEFCILNRDRVLNLIEERQVSIDVQINAMEKSQIDSEFISLIKAWAFDTESWINHTIEADKNILLSLENNKKSITIEIAKLFKSKQAFNGYDLSNTSA
jgi:hypothetical protein